MTTLTFQPIDYAQRTRLLAYIKKENLKFELFEPEHDFLYDKMINLKNPESVI